MKYSEIYRKAFIRIKACCAKALLVCFVSILITSGTYQLIRILYEQLLSGETIRHDSAAVIVIFLIYLAAVIGVYFLTDVLQAGVALFYSV